LITTASSRSTPDTRTCAFGSLEGFQVSGVKVRHLQTILIVLKKVFIAEMEEISGH
jgi:hypothetical protein